MGFRTGSYATIWTVESASDTRTKARISISRKNKQTGEYDTDFSGFVDFIGTAAARKALSLKEKDRIKLGDVDVTNNYSKETGKTYTKSNTRGLRLEITTRKKRKELTRLENG